VAAGFLLFFGLTTPGPAPVQAAANQICKVNGPTTMMPGDTVLYTWRIQDNVEDVFDPFVEDRFWADINDEYGEARIVATLLDVYDGGEQLWKFAEDDDYEDVGERKRLNEIAIVNPNDIDDSLLDYLGTVFDFEMDSNPCGEGAQSVVDYCIDNNECTDFDDAPDDAIDAWVEAMDEALALDFQELVEDSDFNPYCFYLHDEFAGPAFEDAGGSAAEALDILDFWMDVCSDTFPLNPDDAEIGPILDDLGLIAVECIEPGEFEVTRRRGGAVRRAVLRRGGGGGCRRLSPGLHRGRSGPAQHGPYADPGRNHHRGRWSRGHRHGGPIPGRPLRHRDGRRQQPGGAGLRHGRRHRAGEPALLGRDLGEVRQPRGAGRQAAL
jgi:hypothetical protein